MSLIGGKNPGHGAGSGGVSAPWSSSLGSGDSVPAEIHEGHDTKAAGREQNVHRGFTTAVLQVSSDWIYHHSIPLENKALIKSKFPTHRNLICQKQHLEEKHEESKPSAETQGYMTYIFHYNALAFVCWRNNFFN